MATKHLVNFIQKRKESQLLQLQSFDHRVQRRLQQKREKPWTRCVRVWHSQVSCKVTWLVILVNNSCRGLQLMKDKIVKKHLVLSRLQQELWLNLRLKGVHLALELETSRTPHSAEALASTHSHSHEQAQEKMVKHLLDTTPHVDIPLRNCTLPQIQASIPQILQWCQMVWLTPPLLIEMSDSDLLELANK